MATFDRLNTFEEWKNALDAMLDQAINSAGRGEGIGDYPERCARVHQGVAWQCVTSSI